MPAKRGRPPITGTSADLISSKVMNRDILTHWRTEREKRKKFAERAYFLDLDHLLSDGVGDQPGWSNGDGEGPTNREVYAKKGREGLRQRAFRTAIKDHPEMQIVNELARQYDRLMYPDKLNPETGEWEPNPNAVDIDNAVKILGQMARRVDAVEKGLGETYNQQMKIALEAIKMEKEKAKAGLLSKDSENDALEATIATPADVLKQMRKDGLDEDACKQMLGAEYEQAAAELDG